MARKGWAGLLVLAVVATVWSSCGGDETGPTKLTTPVVSPTKAAGVPSGTAEGTAEPTGPATSVVPPTKAAGVPAQTASGTAKMVVDAVSGGEINATAEVRGTGPFAVDISILGATIGYQGYQYYLEWDPKTLAFDSHTYLKPAGLGLCATASTSANRLAAGCVNQNETTTFAGPVGTITLHCIANGTSSLHLMTSGEQPASFSTTMAARGLIIPTELTDASVTCLGL
jgi:hypothetical protein